METSFTQLDKSNYEIKEKEVIINVNVKVYNFASILNTIYPLLRDHYIIIDGDKSKIIQLRVKPKRSDQDMEELVGIIFNRLNLSLIHEKSMSENRNLVDSILKNTLDKYNDQVK